MEIIKINKDDFQNVEQAKLHFEKLGYYVAVLTIGSIITMDYRLDRIRIYYDENDKSKIIEISQG